MRIKYECTKQVTGNLLENASYYCTFDLITANMIVEHLDSPEVQFKEIYRLLKPGGMFIFYTPNVFGYTTIIYHSEVNSGDVEKKLV